MLICKSISRYYYAGSISVAGANHFQRNFILTRLPDPAERAAFFSTMQGKLISALVIIALILGIAAEGVSLVTGYYNMQKAGAKSRASTAKFHNPFARD